MSSTSSVEKNESIPISAITTTTNQINKLSGFDFFSSIGKPKYVVAPMVDQSELAWRILSRLHGATLAYTPMFHAGLFASDSQPKYFQESFDTSPESLEGVAPFDRPLVVQFCANDKELWLKAAQKVEGKCDAVDLNLGCPQGIAKKGHYGSFLMEEWELIGSMISHLHTNLALPVIAKIRVFPSLSKTLDYASHIFNSGAQLLTVHGRTREMKGQLAGLADWTKIQEVTKLLGDKIPILSNGGLPSSSEINQCLEETGANGVMSAEGNLYNPMIFSPMNAEGGKEYFKCLPVEMKSAISVCDNELLPCSTSATIAPAYAPSTFLAAQYLAIVETLPSTETSGSAVKSHLFKLFRPIWATGRHTDLRDALSGSGVMVLTVNGKKTRSERVQEVRVVVDEFRRRILADTESGLLPPNTNRLLTHEEVITEFNGIIPYSHAQPYFRIAAVPESIEATDSVSSIKRAHSPELDESTNKKSKTDSLKMITTPCCGTQLQPACPNSISAKCSHNSCLACCIKISKGEISNNPIASTSTLPSTSSSTTTTTTTISEKVLDCEFHLDKVRKEVEKAVLKKSIAKEKKRLHKERTAISMADAEQHKLVKKEVKRKLYSDKIEEKKRLAEGIVVGTEEVAQVEKIEEEVKL